MSEKPLKKNPTTGRPRQFLSTDLASIGGLDLEDDGTHIIQKNGNDIELTDPSIGTKTADDLRSTARVSSNDTTPDVLLNKLTAGDGIVIEEVNDGSNESINIESNGQFRYKLDSNLVIEDAFSLNAAACIEANEFDIILNGDAILGVS